MATGRVRWSRIVSISIVGLAFTGAPFVLAHKVNKDFGADHALLSSTLTNVGTSVFLVAIVFFLERGLLQRVSDTAATTTARLVDERTADLTEANRALATELADLRAQFEGAVEADTAARTAPIRTAATDVSFDSIAEAIEAANSHGALDWGTVAVPLKSPADHPELVSFDWRFHPLRLPDGRRSDKYASPQMQVRYIAARNPGGGPGTPVVEVVWESDQSPLDFLMALRAEMVRCGFGEEAKLVGPDLFEHLSDALRDAVAGRLAEKGAWVVGALDIWLADGWAITDAGLVSRDHGNIAKAEFAPPPGRAGRNLFENNASTFDPPAPSGVSEAFWSFVIARAKQKHGQAFSHVGYLGSMYGSEQHQPFNRESTPRGKPGWPPAKPR